jgi:hypothetical protein
MPNYRKHTFYDPNKAFLLEKMIALLVYRISRIKYLSLRLKYAGEIADFSNYTFANFGKVKLRLSREGIWRDIESHLGKKVIFLEFGVASDYLTQWWLDPERPSLGAVDFSYHGFDTFYGLPSQWRDFPVGTFSTDGAVPKINHDKLTFHVGLVENTFSDDFLRTITIGIQLIVFFDLDLFEPTRFVYEKIRPLLSIGDLIYFDEARDKDEREILQDFLVKDFDVRPISASYSNIALLITSVKI